MRYRLENKFTGSFLYIRPDREDGEEQKFDITGLISFAKAFEERNCSYEILFSLIKNISSQGRLIETEGKNINNWILNPSYIFVDPTGILGKGNRFNDDYLRNDEDHSQMRFIYYQGEGDENIEAGLNQLAEFVIEHADYKDDDAIDIAFGFYMKIARGNYVFDDLLV